MHPRAEIAQILCEILFIGLYRYPIDSRRRLPPLPAEHTFQCALINMM